VLDRELQCDGAAERGPEQVERPSGGTPQRAGQRIAHRPELEPPTRRRRLAEPRHIGREHQPIDRQERHHPMP